MDWKRINEKGIDRSTGKVIIKIDKKFFRPIDIQYKHGKSNKAKDFKMAA